MPWTLGCHIRKIRKDKYGTPLNIRDGIGHAQNLQIQCVQGFHLF